jgi:hypothetical protein
VIAARAGLVAVSTSLLGATLSRPPTEQPRLVETLFPHATSGRAKRLDVLWRALWPLVLGGGAVLLRAPSLAHRPRRSRSEHGQSKVQVFCFEELAFWRLRRSFRGRRART